MHALEKSVAARSAGGFYWDHAFALGELLITRPLSARAARDLAARLSGRTADDAVEVPAFAGNQVFRIASGDQAVFLKLGEVADVQREIAVLELLGPRGIPVPAIEAADPSGDRTGVPCALLREVGGDPLRGTAPEFTAVGPILRLVHEVTLSGAGSITIGPQGMRGEDRYWVSTIGERVAGLGPIADAGLVPAGLLGRAVAAVQDRGPLLATRQGGRLLHGDFHPRHVYARDGQITAIIDWGDATCGDPAYDLGRVLHSAVLDDGLRHGFTVVSRVLDSYGSAPWLPAEPAEILMVYAIAFILWSMRCEFAAGLPWAPWWPAQAAALSAIADELDRR